jgi:hypothetical protein
MRSRDAAVPHGFDLVPLAVLRRTTRLGQSQPKRVRLRRGEVGVACADVHRVTVPVADVAEPRVGVNNDADMMTPRR